MKQLKIDDKWSVSYDPDNNERPVAWFRHGEFHSVFADHNATTAMFYALLEATTIANVTAPRVLEMFRGKP